MAPRVRVYIQITERGEEAFSDGATIKESLDLSNPNGHEIQAILNALKASTKTILEVA